MITSPASNRTFFVGNNTCKCFDRVFLFSFVAEFCSPKAFHLQAVDAKVLYVLPAVASGAHHWYGTAPGVDMQNVEVKSLECWVLTSPNLDELPEFNIGPQPLRARDDGRFGFEDPVQVPQQFDRDFPHLPCIQRHDSGGIPDCMKEVVWDGFPSFTGINDDFSRGVGLYEQDQVTRMKGAADK